MSDFEQNQRLSIIGGILQHETRLLPELWSRSCIRAVAIWLLFKGRPSAAPLKVLVPASFLKRRQKLARLGVLRREGSFLCDIGLTLAQVA